MFTFTTLVETEKEKQDQTFDTFEDAFRCMYHYVTDTSKKLSWQVLETCLWIKMPNRSILNVCDAKDLAYHKGILVDGKLTI